MEQKKKRTFAENLQNLKKSMSIVMKKKYLAPMIRIQPIESEDDIMEMSLPVYDEKNPYTREESNISDGSDILGNQHSVWDEEE